MNRIDELVERLCPDGVEYIKLKECAEIGTGSSDRKDSTEDGEYPFFVRSKQVYRKNSYEYDEEAVIVPGEGGIGEIFHYVNGKYALHQRVYRIHLTTKRINARFLLHYMKFAFKDFIIKKAVTATVASIRKPMLSNFAVPVPPMEVQEEIVRVLDSFAELEAELEAELGARKVQYAYYRDKLISGCSSVIWMPLLQIAEDCDRARKPIKKDRRASGKVPYYGASGIVDYVSGFTHEGDYLLLSEDGANLLARSMPIAFQISGRNWVNNHAHVLRIDDARLRKLVEVYLNSISLEPYISKGAQPKLTKQKMGEIAVPVPSQKDLSRIVDILEGFESLLDDISQGLPAEIEARRKQYAYYRDRLLAFKEKTA